MALAIAVAVALALAMAIAVAVAIAVRCSLPAPRHYDDFEVVAHVAHAVHPAAP